VETRAEELHLRKAAPADIPALTALIELSVRVLQAGDYSSEQIAGALGTLLGVDTRLIADGTYLVLETSSGQVAGCGGWSKRKTLFGSDHAPGREEDWLDPHVDAAKIRAFFIHPDWARRGLGSRILAACESEALAAGFRRFELGATLTGERLFRARGYAVAERIEAPLPNGASLPIIRMIKAVSCGAGCQPAAGC
jgi:GNAT superfamily N-acetyltransferase